MECNIIKDLIPLYIDDCCSPESAKLVKEHMDNCKQCKELYESLKPPLDMAPPAAVPARLLKINSWKASVLQSVLLFVSFAIIAVGVALEAGTFGFINGFWAFTMVIPATGFMLSLANWYFIRLYKSKKLFSRCCVIATVGITFAAFIWACFHYDMSLFDLFDSLASEYPLPTLGALMYYFLPGVILSAVFCVVSEIASKKYASFIGKE